jgi:hypothetical protein
MSIYRSHLSHPALEKVRNATFHTGHCHALPPELLRELAEKQENVDSVLVDGDHSADGVERDMRDLIGSRAVSRKIILAHDTMNDEVRAGLQRIDFAAERSVVFAVLDFISGHLLALNAAVDVVSVTLPAVQMDRSNRY